MDSTFLSLIIFAIITIVYYLFKPKPMYMLVESNEESVKDFGSKKMTYLVIYFLTVVISQFAINASVISANCGGSLKDNIGSSAVITFVPWIFIFGSMIVIMLLFPGFKSAFSNVIGYFAVAGSANSVLSKLLVNSELESMIENESTSEEHKKGLKRAAESIVKLTGNKSIMINQIVPENFKEYWAILEPLMKREYFETKKLELVELKKQLFDLTVMRDSIGEAIWYFYTAVLLTFIVQYNIVVKGCVKNPDTLAASLKTYTDETQAAAQAQLNMDSQAYIT